MSGKSSFFIEFETNPFTIRLPSPFLPFIWCSSPPSQQSTFLLVHIPTMSILTKRSRCYNLLPLAVNSCHRCEYIYKLIYLSKNWRKHADALRLPTTNLISVGRSKNLFSFFLLLFFWKLLSSFFFVFQASSLYHTCSICSKTQRTEWRKLAGKK